MIKNIKTRIKWSISREIALERILYRIEEERRMRSVERKVKNLPYSWNDEKDYFREIQRYYRKSIIRIRSRKYGIWYCIFGSPFPITTDTGAI